MEVLFSVRLMSLNAHYQIHYKIDIHLVSKTMGLESSVTHSVDHNNGLYQIQYWCLLLKNNQVMAPLSEWRRYKQNQINDTKADCTEAVECIMIVNQGKQKHFEQSTEPKINKITTQKSNRKRWQSTKKRWGICTYSYNIYKWFNNGQWICSHVPCPESIITYNEGHTV